MPNSSGIDTYWMEMVISKANYCFIPAYKDIPQIVLADVRRCHPARFNGKDRALLASEAAVHPLVNSAPATEDGMDLSMFGIALHF